MAEHPRHDAAAGRHGEGSVELDPVDRQSHEVLDVRVAGSEVVDIGPDSGGPQLFDLCRRIGNLDRVALDDLDADVEPAGNASVGGGPG